MASRVLLLLGLCACVGASHAQEFTFEAVRAGGAVRIVATADLPTDARKAWDVLTDYDHLAEFIPSLQTSRVVERNGHSLVLEQKGKAGFLFFTVPVEVRLAVEERPFERVNSRAIGGSMREMEGSYELHAIPGGVRLVYKGRMVPESAVPAFIETVAIRNAAKTQFAAMVREILRRAATGEASVGRDAAGRP